MFVMMNRMSVPEEHRARFEEMFRTRARAVDRRPGFIRAEILKPSHGNEYIVMTHWESEQAFSEWVHSSEYAEGHKRAGEFKGDDGESALTSKVETFEILAT
jgi:heme-degrading monooxygenase HmoA